MIGEWNGWTRVYNELSRTISKIENLCWWYFSAYEFLKVAYLQHHKLLLAGKRRLPLPMHSTLPENWWSASSAPAGSSHWKTYPHRPRKRFWWRHWKCRWPPFPAGKWCPEHGLPQWRRRPGFFAQQLLGLGNAGDVFLGISTSGNSENILYVAVLAKAMDMKVIALTGAGGGKLKPLADSSICVPEQKHTRYANFTYQCIIVFAWCWKILGADMPYDRGVYWRSSCWLVLWFPFIMQKRQ